MVCIQETKREIIEKKVCKAMWGDSEVKWELSLANNTTGGLLCMCDGDIFEMENCFKGDSFLELVGLWKIGNKKVTFVNVYAPNDRGRRRHLWVDLKVKQLTNHMSLWCMVGDFNYVRWPHERQVGAITKSYDNIEGESSTAS